MICPGFVLEGPDHERSPGIVKVMLKSLFEHLMCKASIKM